MDGTCTKRKENRFKLHMWIPTSINRIQRSTTSSTEASPALKD